MIKLLKEAKRVKAKRVSLGFLVVLFTGLVSASKSYATTEAERVLDWSQPEYEDRYYTLIDELRCPKCQNQNLADSNAPIAVDLKSELQRLLEEGKSNTEILDFMTLRYGNFVLYKPPVNAATIALWIIPVLIVISGLFILFGFIRRSSQSLSSTTSGQPVDRQKAVDQLIKELESDSNE